MLKFSFVVLKLGSFDELVGQCRPFERELGLPRHASIPKLEADPNSTRPTAQDSD